MYSIFQARRPVALLTSTALLAAVGVAEAKPVDAGKPAAKASATAAKAKRTGAGKAQPGRATKRSAGRTRLKKRARTVVRARAAGVVFADDFESGNLAKWTTTSGSVAVKKGAGRNGGFGIVTPRLAQAAFAGHSFSASSQVKVEFCYQQQSGGWQPLVSFADTNLQLANDGGGGLHAVVGGKWVKLGSFTGQLWKWYCAAVSVDAAADRLTLDVNGARISSISATISPETTVRLGDAGNSSVSGPYAFDDVRIETSGGPVAVAPAPVPVTAPAPTPTPTPTAPAPTPTPTPTAPAPTPTPTAPAPTAPTTKPAIPTGLKVVSARAGAVELDWNDNSGSFGHYQVYRDNGLISNGPTESRFVDTTAVEGQTYEYRVSAGASPVYGDWTTPVYASIPLPAGAPAPAPTPTPTTAPSGDLVWQANYDALTSLTDVKPAWQEEQEPSVGGVLQNTRIRAVGGADLPGSGAWKPAGKAMRVELRPFSGGSGDSLTTSGYTTNRAEVYGRHAPSSTTPPASWPDPVGSERWYGWSMYTPSDFVTSNSWMVFTQWKGFRGGSPPLALEMSGDRVQLASNPFGLRHDVASVSSMKGGWTRFIMGVKWSNSGAGWVEMWRALPDGTLQQVMARRSMQTMETINGQADPIYLKQGIYRDTAWSATNSLFYGPMKIGTSKAAVDR